MNFIFVDTSGWFATIARKDPDHLAAQAFFRTEPPSFLTTDYVLDETVTLLQARLDHGIAVRFLDSIEASPKVRMDFLSRSDIETAIGLFRDRPDKGWSLTDRTSFVIMKKLGIPQAFAFDAHFRQAGFQVVPPPRSA